MIKSESNNTFGEGLMMDMNPLTTPNSVMTNCLNGTLITFNGNEYILQNDMGNGRVETAFLPEGFVPLGTTELGGIIYIVSYNPNTNRCQIGSFPSPERNITSNEVAGSPDVSLDNNDFGYNDVNTGAKVYYLKKNLNSKLTFNPGDKFIVYGDTIDINKDKIQGIDYLGKSLKEETIRLYIGTVTSDGKLIIFDDLKRFKIDSEGHEYYIYQYTNDDSSNDGPDLSNYRSLVSEPYNIFNSKVSGELVVIAELVQCTSFEAEISHKFDTNKRYIPDVTFKFNGEYNYLPYGVQCNLQLIGKDANGNDITIRDNITYTCEAFEKYNNGDSPKSAFTEICHNILNPIVQKEVELPELDPVERGTRPIELNTTIEKVPKPTEISKYLQNNYDFTKQQRTPLVLTYEFIPCMNWGPVNYLTVRGQIDLAKLGTGIIELNSWRYYNTDKKCNLTWGLDVYEEEGCKVSGVTFELTRFINSNEDKESITYHINKKTSYHGTFYEVIPLNENYYKIEAENGSSVQQLKSNNLYLVKITVNYSRPHSETDEKKFFYRWLYTNQCFNDKYYKEKDYKALTLEFDTKAQLKYDLEIDLSDYSYRYGVLRTKASGNTDQDAENLDSKTSISVSQTVKAVTAKCNAQFLLKNNYNSFNLKLYEGGAKVEINKNNKASLTITNDLKYIGIEDANYKTYLKNYMLEDWDGTVPELSKDTSPDDLVSDTKKYGNGLYISQAPSSITYDQQTNSYSFDVSCKLLQLVKAYCSKKKELLHYKGRFIPLCYNSSTFSNYNLVIKSGKWVPDILGLFFFKEPGGSKGEAWVGLIRKDSPNQSTSSRFALGNNVDVNFGTDSEILIQEQRNGWKNTSMFVAHYGTNVNEPRQTWVSLDMKNPSWINKDSEWWFSVDPCWQGNTNKALVILMMTSSENDGRYYPINFCKTSRINSNTANYFNESTGFYGDLYSTFAQILNNIYKYDQEGLSQDFIIPDSIYYGDNYTYDINIPIEMTINDINKCTVEMKLEDGTYIPLSVFADLVPENSDVDTSNISSTVKNVEQSPKIIIQDTNSDSINLRNHIIDEAAVKLGNIIYDFDGETIIGEELGDYKTTKLYCRKVLKEDNKVNVTKVIEEAFSFRPVKIVYDANGQAQPVGNDTQLLYQTKSGADWPKEEDSKQNLSKDFMLSENGYLVIKSPEKFGFSFKREGGDDDGSVTGYQKIGFNKLYKAWL